MRHRQTLVGLRIRRKHRDALGQDALEHGFADRISSLASAWLASRNFARNSEALRCLRLSARQKICQPGSSEKPSRSFLKDFPEKKPNEQFVQLVDIDQGFGFFLERRQFID